MWCIDSNQKKDEKLKMIKAKGIQVGNGTAGNSDNGGKQPITPLNSVEPIPEIVIKTKTLSMRELVKGQKTIKNNNDIDDVVEALRKKLREELDKDTIISLV